MQIHYVMFMYKKHVVDLYVYKCILYKLYMHLVHSYDYLTVCYTAICMCMCMRCGIYPYVHETLRVTFTLL